MQVLCGNCQLSFEAPDGASGLVCPICRNPLQADAPGGAGAAKSAAIDWNGGTLEDLIALVTAPAVSARVEVFAEGSDTPAGEVHLLAGGVSDALFAGKSTDDALDKLLVLPKTRFRVEQRLPSPVDGDLSVAGPESGTLDARPLAHLMRYCEDYVITCSIEVWRGTETARVEYKRGEINGVTVGGIDAPERLAEVMQWASGNYRLSVPRMTLPAVAPKRPQAAAAVPAPVPAPAPSAQAARQQSASGASAATRTIFGMAPVEVAAARAAADVARAADAARTAEAKTTAPAAAAASASPNATVLGAAPAPALPVATPAAGAPISLAALAAAATPATPPGVPPAATPAPTPSPARGSATKTIFGVPAPQLPSTPAKPAATPAAPAASAAPAPAPAPAAPAPAPAPAAAAPAPAAESGRPDRKTGARKVAVPAPEIAATAASARAALEPPAVKEPDPGRATHQGYDSTRAPQAVGQGKDKDKKGGDAGEKTEPVRVAPPRPRETPIWTYVGVGFTFGLALLGIYQLVGRLAH